MKNSWLLGRFRNPYIFLVALCSHALRNLVPGFSSFSMRDAYHVAGGEGSGWTDAELHVVEWVDGTESVWHVEGAVAIVQRLR